MLPQEINSELVTSGIKVQKVNHITGGDINEARQLIDQDGTFYFLKFNTASKGSALLNSELKGLSLLMKQDVRTPQILQQSTDTSFPFILMNWINEGPRDSHQLAQALSNIHNNKSEQFGLDHDNHIGSLAQSNLLKDDFYEFYLQCRIEPQIKMAKDNGFSLPIRLEGFEAVIRSEIPSESPTLIHGDLWSGNLIDSVDGPVFIDPSTSYSHREQDLAMMRLFGGFDISVLNHYNELLPLELGYEQRADIFQLYYLLIHLNIFGSSYKAQVERILRKYLN